MDFTWSGENLVGGEAVELWFGHWTGAMGSLRCRTCIPCSLSATSPSVTDVVGVWQGRHRTSPQQLASAQASARQCLPLSGAQSDSLFNTLSRR